MAAARPTQPRPNARSISWRDLLTVAVPIGAVVIGALWIASRYMHAAPPTRIRMLTGPEGSSYRNQGDKYKKIIETHGVKVELLPSQGGLDNLKKLADPKAAVDVGFVQGGLADGLEGVNLTGLVSLGTLFTQPVTVYYKLPEPVERLTELRGKRVAIGPEGSGARALALKMFKANDMDEKSVTFSPLAAEEAAKALTSGEIDACFLMGDSTAPKVARGLRESPGVRLMNFRQADGYVRRLKFLSRLTLPEGAMDLGKNYPPETVQLVGPGVELIARPDLHPALSDMLISAAREIHGGPGMYRAAGEYPAPREHEFPISDDAERYYKSGGKFLYKTLPFWLASLLDRLLVVILPLLVVVVPATRVAPSLYRWRVRSRIYRWYGALMAIERDMMGERTSEEKERIGQRLDEIERAVDGLKMPLSFADQLYVLRDHVAGVRRRLESGHYAS